jgi:hypothetical protein
MCVIAAVAPPETEPMKHCRRVLSHHGSDCPEGPHPIKGNRCLILTRIDRPGQPSEAWVSGDYAETGSMRWKQDQHPDAAPGDLVSERLYRKRHTFDASLPTHYGGQFWAYVELGPVEPPPNPVGFFRADYGVYYRPGGDWPIDGDGDYLVYSGTRAQENDPHVTTLWVSARLLTAPIPEAQARAIHPALFEHLAAIDRGGPSA